MKETRTKGRYDTLQEVPKAVKAFYRMDENEQAGLKERTKIRIKEMGQRLDKWRKENGLSYDELADLFTDPSKEDHDKSRCQSLSGRAARDYVDGYLTISLERWRLFFQNVNQLEEVRKPDVSWLLLGMQSKTDYRLRRPEEIGRELNDFLKSMQCKKESIAEILGVSPRTILRYIKGKPEIKLLQLWMLREVFQEEISLSQLLLEKIEQ